MRRSLLVLALLVALPAFAEETLAVLVVDGKAVDAEPRMLDPDTLAFPMSQWEAWGVLIPRKLRKDTLSAQELGVGVEYDMLTTEVRLTIPAHLRPSRKLGYARTLPDKVSPAPKGVMVDYDVAVVHTSDSQRASVGHVVRSGVAGGVLTTTGQANWVDGKADYVRGTTTWRRDYLASGTSLQVGDVGLAANGMNDPAVLGGVRVGSDRQLTRWGAGVDIPLIGGVADTRSTAEVLVNEHQRATGEIPAGPFELSPTVAVPGLNNVDVIQRDEFGREQTFSRSFYAHPDLLRRGSKEWDIAAGAVRIDPTEDTYKGFAAQGSYRYGLSDRWTIGTTVQMGKVGDEGGRNVTLHNTVSLGRGGLLQADVSASQREDGAKGTAFRVGYEQRRENWSLSASHLVKSDDYWEISQLQDRPFRIQSQTTAALAFQPKDQPWRAMLSYSDIQYNDDRRLKQVGLSGSYRNGRTTWMAGAMHDLSTGDNQAYVGVYMPLGTGNLTATARSAPSTGPQLTAVYSDKTEFHGRDVRYQVGGSLGDTSQVYGRVDTTLAGGDLSLEARKGTGQPLMLNGRYSNSLWIGEGGVINGRGYNPYGSFAVVEVPGHSGVELQGSSTIATTNKNGYALVRNLPSLAPVPVLLDANQLPLDQQVDDPYQQVIAPRGGGAKVTFNVAQQTSRQYVVRLGDGFAPQGSSVETDTGETFKLADRGVLVLEKPATRAWLTSSNLKCELVLPPGGGDVSCRP